MYKNYEEYKATYKSAYKSAYKLRVEAKINLPQMRGSEMRWEVKLINAWFKSGFRYSEAAKILKWPKHQIRWRKNLLNSRIGGVIPRAVREGNEMTKKEYEQYLNKIKQFVQIKKEMLKKNGGCC